MEEMGIEERRRTNVLPHGKKPSPHPVFSVHIDTHRAQTLTVTNNGSNAITVTNNGSNALTVTNNGSNAQTFPQCHTSLGSNGASRCPDLRISRVSCSAPGGQSARGWISRVRCAHRPPEVTMTGYIARPAPSMSPPYSRHPPGQ